MLIQAVKKDEELVAEIDSFRTGDEQLHLWWLGQSGFLLQWKGKRVLIDPYLSDSLTRKYADTDKPHIRMSERVISPNLLKHIAIITSSHNHTDHLDAETVIPVLQGNPGIQFIIPEANRAFVAERIGCTICFPTGITDGEEVAIGDFTFHGIPAKHNEIDRDEQGRCRYLGYVISLGDFTIYHSGDTLWFNEMPELLQPFTIDIAILPINGNDPARKVAGNLDSKEAAALAKVIGAGVVIPCHYNMFTFNTANVDDFMKDCETLGQPYKILRGGEGFHFSKTSK